MKDRPEVSPLPIIEELKDGQQHYSWPQMTRNNTAVFKLLWYGNPNAKPVQRIGMVIFGIWIIAFGLFPLDINAYGKPEANSVFPYLIFVSFALLGFRFILNGFRRKTKDVSQAKDSDQELRP